MGETESLVTRAARGAGLSWGQAQETGRAVSRLGAAGLPAVDWLAALLPSIEATPYAERCPRFAMDAVTGQPSASWAARGHGMCPIALGCSFGDFLQCLPSNEQGSGFNRFEFKGVWWPGLVAGFLMPVTNRLAGSIRLEFDGGGGLMSRGILLPGGNWTKPTIKKSETVVATVCPLEEGDDIAGQGMEQQPAAHRFLIADVIYKSLQQYAHKTYVPSSDAARAHGAGAGLTDND